MEICLNYKNQFKRLLFLYYLIFIFKIWFLLVYFQINLMIGLRNSVDDSLRNAQNITLLNSRVQNIENRLYKISSQDSEQVQENPFKDKWISILGDSISTYPGYIPETQVARDHEGFDTVDKCWWHQLITKLGAKLCVNYSGSGMRLSGTDEILGACYKEYEKKLHREAGKSYINIDGTTEIANENIKPDIIFVYLGTNDFLSNAELGSEDMAKEIKPRLNETDDNVMNALDIILYNIIVSYPYACVYVITPQLLRKNPTSAFPFKNGATTPWNMSEFMEESRKACLKMRTKWIPLANYCLSCSSAYKGNGQFMLNDGIHPSVNGHKLIANICYYNMIHDPVSWNTRNDI